MIRLSRGEDPTSEDQSHNEHESFDEPRKNLMLLVHIHTLNGRLDRFSKACLAPTWNIKKKPI